MGANVFEGRGMLDKGGGAAFLWLLWFGMFVALAGAPLALALAPAAVSTRCDELKDGLTMLRAKDLEGQATRIDALYNFLDQVNNKQGIGFAAGGGVQDPIIDKKFLFEAAITVYAVLGFVVPYALDGGGKEVAIIQGGMPD